MAQEKASTKVNSDFELEKLQVSNKQRIFLVVTITLLLLSTVLLGIRIADYAQQDKREVTIEVGSDAEVHLFALQYTNESGEVIIQSNNEDKVVAPGSGSSYTVRLRNADEYALDYELKPKGVFSTRYQVPLQVKMKTSDGEYVLGSDEQWATLQDLRSLTHTGTLEKTKAAEYVFEWQWPYESGNDGFDTELGNQDRDVGVEVSFTFHAVANTTLDANGGWEGHPDMGKNLALAMAAGILLISAIVAIVVIVKKRKEALAGIVDPEFVPAPKQEKQEAPGSTQTITLEMLAANFHGAAVINLATLKRRGLVPVNTSSIHLAASPNFVLTKPFVIFVNSASADAKRIVASAGGAVVIS